MRGSEIQCAGRYHGVNGGGFVAWGSGFWFPLRYDRPKVISSDWFGGLVNSFYLFNRVFHQECLYVLTIFRCIGSIIVCASQNIPMLIVGRIINGLSVGICSAQVPVYISELVRPPFSCLLALPGPSL